MKKPSSEDAATILRLRKQSRSGHYLSPSEMRLCESFFIKYPEWYEYTDEEVFNDTVPLGSNVKYKPYKEPKQKKNNKKPKV
jgi:hypothetical protein